MPGRRFDASIGWAALLLTVTIWAGFSLSIRAIGVSALTAADVALIRFGVPAVLLLPFVPSRMAMLRSVPWRGAIMIVVGAGLPFFMLAAAGGRLTSAAHVSALIAGPAPLMVTLIGRAWFGRRIATGLRPGLLAIVLGVILMVAELNTDGTTVGTGAALLLTASLLWAGYTIAMRQTTCDPLACAMLVTYPSLALLLPAIATGVFDSHIAAVAPVQLMPFVLVQGIAVGMGSIMAYAVALRRLGTLQCATIGSLTPVIATIAAVPLLGEIPTLFQALGVLLVTAGVLLCNPRGTRDTG